MASRVFEALSSVVQPVLISANRSLNSYQALAPEQVYPDDPGLSGQGPLAGLLTGMRVARVLGARAVLVSPCDTPDITPGVFAGLLEAWASNPERPAIAMCERRAHPLHGVYPVASDRLLERQLSDGNRRVMVFAEAAGAAGVDCSGAAQALRNRNRPEDF
jgi:molybdopterin-guanine dinucleotide biosynthesis protein A